MLRNRLDGVIGDARRSRTTATDTLRRTAGRHKPHEQVELFHQGNSPAIWALRIDPQLVKPAIYDTADDRRNSRVLAPAADLFGGSQGSGAGNGAFGDELFKQPGIASRIAKDPERWR